MPARRQREAQREAKSASADMPAANPTFSTGGLQARESAQNRGLDPKGLHYMTDLPEPAVPPAAVILGGGCGGNARFNCCKSIFCSLGSSV